MAEIAFLPAAEVDYQDALACYAERSPQAALAFEAAIEVALQRISESPELWTLCDDRHRFYLLRRFPYSVVYREEADRVVIVAVAHSRRSESFWQDRS